MNLEEEWASAKVDVSQEWENANPSTSVEPSGISKVIGSVPGRLVAGAVRQPLGLAQVIGNLTPGMQKFSGGGDDLNRSLQQLEETKKRGGLEGYDFAGLTGEIASTAATLPQLGLKTATTLGSKVLQGAGIGGALGFSTPVTDGGEDFASQKALQTGIGTATGGAVPAAISGLKLLGKGALDVGNLFLPKGAERIANKYIDTILGSEKSNVAKALSESSELVSGSKPTAAEVVSPTTGASPLVALQSIVSKTPGGISAEFGKRKMDQEVARLAARTSLNESTAPLREKALKLANVGGGVNIEPIIKKIGELQSKPDAQALTLVKKSLASIKDDINSLAKENGKIDAEVLYGVRKQISKTIKGFSKETSTFDKKLTAGIESDVNKIIDSAIENSGGVGWKKYLAEYSKGKAAIDADILRSKNAYKPLQKTDLRGGVEIAEGSRAHVPNLLSRPAMIVNAILRYGGKSVEPEVDAVLARKLLNPAQMAKEMTPAEKSELLKALMFLKNPSRVAPPIIANESSLFADEK